MRRRLALLPTVALALAGPLLAHAATELIPRISVLKPPSWDAAIVARLTSGAAPGDPLTTATALSPILPVWFDWAVSANAAIGGNWIDQMLIDGATIQTLPRWNGTFLARNWYASMRVRCSCPPGDTQ